MGQNLPLVLRWETERGGLGTCAQSLWMNEALSSPATGIWESLAQRSAVPSVPQSAAALQKPGNLKAWGCS